MSLRQFTFCPIWSSQKIRVLRGRELFGFWNKMQCSALFNFFILAEPCCVPNIYWVTDMKEKDASLDFFSQDSCFDLICLFLFLHLCKCMVCTWCHTINYGYKRLSCDSSVSCISPSDQQICLFFLHWGAGNCCYFLTVTCGYLK